ncbi:MAG: aspartate aminotransferase family protein, partial [Proteobacteria bacterium]|nr:aspartate aminotransferase family protein [Pseudomonadota bacterium]
QHPSVDAGDGVGAYLAKRAEAHGIICRAISDTLAFAPPLIIEESEIDEIITAVGKALDDTMAMVEEKGIG